MTPEQIAAICPGNLPEHIMQALAECDPDHIIAPVSTLIGLCLYEFALIRPDNTVFLTDVGLQARPAVRAILEKEHG